MTRRLKSLLLVAVVLGLVPAAHASREVAEETHAFNPPVYERPLDINAGVVLDLCDKDDAARAGLDMGDLGVDLDAIGLTCADDEESFALLGSSGTLIRGSKEELEQVDVPRLRVGLGSHLAPTVPEADRATDGIVTDSLRVEGDRVLGWAAAEAQEPTALGVTCMSGDQRATDQIPVVALPGEVVPFAVTFAKPPADPPDCFVEARPTSAGSEARMFAVTDSPGFWTGPVQDFPGVKGMLAQIHETPSGLLTYYQSFVEPRAAVNVPNADELVAEGMPDVRVLAAITDENGALIDVHAVTLWSERDTDIPTDTLSARSFGLVGVFLPTASSELSLWVSVQPEVK